MSHRIVRLQVENVKRLKAADVTPRKNVTIVASKKNEQGKSTLLDSILYAFGGGDSLPKKPIRTGQEKGSIDIDLGDIKIKRTFTKDSSQVVVSNAEGLKYPSPQALLDRMYGKVAFDPFEFSREEPVKQSETLRKLVGLDFKTHDETRGMIYDKRREEGRELRSLEARLLALKFTEGLPDKEETTEAILKEQTQAAEQNKKNQDERVAYSQSVTAMDNANQVLEGLEKECKDTELKITQLQEQLKRQRQLIAARKTATAEVKAKLDIRRTEIDKLIDVDLTPFQDKAKKVEDTNRLIRANNDYLTVKENLQAKKIEIDDYTKRLDAMDADKAKQIREAKYPIEGLSIDADGEIVYNGDPFSQASTAASIRVSVAIGIALNPDLKVMIIREGSMLDDDNLAVIAEMAEKSESQVWIEQVGLDGDVSVVIEDGQVIGGPAKTTPEEIKADQEKKAKKKEAPVTGKLL